LALKGEFGRCIYCLAPAGSSLYKYADLLVPVIAFIYKSQNN